MTNQNTLINKFYILLKCSIGHWKSLIRHEASYTLHVTLTVKNIHVLKLHVSLYHQNSMYES